MNAEEIQKYKDQLIEQRERLVRQLNENQRQSFEFGAEDMPDPVDAAVQDRSQTILLSISESERDLIEQIDDAISRIESGDYGVCQNCEQDIAPARLNAVPYARYCINCQDKLERGLLDDSD